MATHRSLLCISLFDELTIVRYICREGLGFYSRIHENVSKLRKRVLEVMGTRSKERENVERYYNTVFGVYMHVCIMWSFVLNFRWGGEKVKTTIEGPV